MIARRSVLRGGICLLTLLVAGCAAFGPSETPAGPGVPRIAHLRFEPDTVAVGETTQMSFYFETGSADLEEGYLLDQGIAQFQFFTALQRIIIDLSKYAGQVAGVAEVSVRIPTEGVRWLELQVISRQGNLSNRLRARLTVR